jgi:S-DNA-T family DNA segregation ATPase FtsK/SpoIIIE
MTKKKRSSKKSKRKSKSTRGSKSSRKPSRRVKNKKKGPTLQLPEIHLTLDQYLDIVGYTITLGALLLALSFLSPNPSSIPGKVLMILRQGVGWGAYPLPFLIGAIGLRIVLRQFSDKLPRLTPLQIIGLLLGSLALLTTLHLLATFLLGNGDMVETARQGLGGGYLGQAIGAELLNGLGGPGMVTALVVWWLIVIFFTFEVTIKEIIEKLQGVRESLPLPRHSKPLPKPSQERTAGRPRAPQKESASSTRAQSEPIINTAPSPTTPAAPITTHVQDPETSQLIGSTHAWQLPLLDEILEPGDGQDFSEEILRQQARIIEDTLESLGAPVRVKEINRGPVVTQFGLEPLTISNGSGKETKVKVSRIEALAGDVALALEAKTLRIEAPIPGKGLVGMEIPNPEVSLVALRDVIESDEFAESDAPLKLCLGQDVSGNAVVADMTTMPHLLIAGTTGSGKSVCVNAIIAALLLQHNPDQLEFLMVDPKRVELIGYNGIPHLRQAKVVVEMERVTAVLQWMLGEMDRRYRKFSKVRAIHIRDYNERVAPEAGEPPLPYIVTVIDELADLMMLSPQETEKSLCRIAQMARATGIHLIIATQRPSVDVVTGLIKANFPARIAFNVASAVDSRVILDMPGAEQLLGRGDMLFMPPDAPTPMRLQGAFVSDEELRRLVQYWKNQARPEAVPGATPVQKPLWEEMQREALRVKFEDDLMPDVIDLVLRENRASISLMQRKLRIGYTRAARIMDILERQKIVGPQPSGGKAREVFPSAARKLLESSE